MYNLNVKTERAIRRSTFGLTLITALAGLGLLGYNFWGGGEVLRWKPDGLTAFFLVILFLGQGISSLYAWSYMKEYEGKKSLLLFAVSWLAFIGSMFGVLMVKDGFTFLLFWEVMSLFSFFLVMYEHEESQNRRAAYIYLVMTHLGTVFLTSVVLYFYAKTGSFAFASWAAYSPNLSIIEKNLLFLGLFIGLGTKAGLVPFHIWLPYAHPVAPTPVSALMSGVMVKIALYLMLRLIYLTLGPVELWWGGLLLLTGIISAFVGILYASVQQDVKRVLAYSTVENVGILAIALGTAMLSQALGYPQIAQLALFAFFWHVLHHLLFKSSLFMVAGNLIQATHTRSLEKMGGLLRRLPWTGFWAMFGALGLASLPPLGGFWGEWLLFQSLYQTAHQAREGGVKFTLLLVIAALGLVSALALATMVKWFASAFLGQARSPEAKTAEELPKSQTGSLGIAISLTFGAILWPKGVFQLISLPVQSLFASSPERFSSVSVETSNSLVMSGFFASVKIYGLLLLLITGLLYLLTRGQRRRVGATWNCGTPLTPRMQYSSLGITMPLRILFKQLLGSKSKIEKEYSETRYVVRNLSYTGKTRERYEEIIYRPFTHLLLWCAERIRTLQGGSIHFYLGYMLITLVIVLIWSL
ncbi:proton-conducting transporter membrane subunit [Desulfitobacterium metallireducens]|uniref:Oxidoreductase n=1 Tax=Desulfitobacterium metallireducens DSM 15288 TaxID=871968 RepID=W0EAS8_9FIRM|nr:proton-conducting transporter membrane subunit [Desulfitobacterium metallireducens]AHF07862.1 oxidoreductase [Desulfitobacterium metallireducens DSM 15288]